MFARVYTAFEAADVYGKDALLGRILNSNLAVECLFPSKENAWHKDADALMKQAQAGLVLLSRQADGAAGLQWEMKELVARKIPTLYVQVHADPQLQMRNVSAAPCIVWDWDAIQQFLINGAV